MEPKFVEISLTDLMQAGVLMAANERFFWPLGLALTWNFDRDTGEASGLHIRQWQYGDGHVECIETEDDDVTLARRAAFCAWSADRLAAMPIESEREMAASVAAARP